MLIDAHVHLDRYGDRLDAALSEIERERIFTVATAMDVPSYVALQQIAARSSWVMPTFGIHPRRAADYADRLEELRPYIASSPAIGEIGLDFHWVRDPSTYPKQRRVCEYFIAAAAAHDKFVNLHTKAGEAEVLALLRKYELKRAIVHWYSGPIDILHQMIAHGCWFTIGVEVLFSDHIRAIARTVPDHLLLTETDNPGALGWLRKTDEAGMPGAIRLVVAALAELRQTSFEAIENLVAENFCRLLGADGRLFPTLAR
jgi:TatD DNase family protein